MKLNKRILLLNSGNLRKLFILKILRKMGVKVVCLDWETKSFAKDYVEDWILADLDNEQECLDKVKEYTKSKKIDGVVTFWDECVLLNARIAEEFNWVGLSYKVADQIKNKYSFREYCRENGVPAPKNQLINSEKDLVKLKRLKFPIVFKPIFGACSAFVVKVNKISEAQKVFSYIKNNIKSFWLSSEWKNFKVMAEEYIEGWEVDIDFLVQDGILKYSAITDNEKTDEPFFVEKGQSMPSALKINLQKRVLDQAFAFLKNLGVNNGCFHFEGKVTKGGIVPIELNLRMGGGDVYLFSKSVWGVDLVEQAVKIALNLKVRIKKPSVPKVYLKGRQFLSKYSCLIEDIKVDKKIFKEKYLKQLIFEKKVGDKFLAPPEGYDGSIGWLIVSGNNISITRQNWQKARKMIKLKLSKLK